MNPPLAIVTGFGPFPSVPDNPSEKVAKFLQSEPPDGIKVRALELPVSFARAKSHLEAFLSESSERPALLLGLGAHRKGYFRLERRARPVLDSLKPDNEGQFAADVPPLGDQDLVTSFDLERAAEVLAGPELEPVMISNQAGGYVCELTYHALLEAGDRLGVPALFLHVPPAEFLAPKSQARYVRELILHLVSGAE